MIVTSLRMCIRSSLLLLAMLTATGQAASIEEDAQRFGRLPAIGDARLSPDGSR